MSIVRDRIGTLNKAPWSNVWQQRCPDVSGGAENYRVAAFLSTSFGDQEAASIYEKLYFKFSHSLVCWGTQTNVRIHKIVIVSTFRI
jgi:hypothetical protein